MNLLLTYNQNPSNYEKFKSYEKQKLIEACQLRGYAIKLYHPSNFPSINTQSKKMTIINMSGVINTSHYRFLRNAELFGNKLLNSAEGTNLAEEKMLSNMEMFHAGFPVPKTIDLNLSHTSHNIDYLVKRVIEELGLPCVIKGPNGNNGNSVIKVENANDLVDILGILGWNSIKYNDCFNTNNMMAQQMIKTSIGKVIRVVYLSGDILGAELKSNPDFWKPQSLFVFQSSSEVLVNQGKYIPSSNYTREKIAIDQDMIKLSHQVSKLFNLDFFGLDLLIGPEGYLICEVNTSPQLEGFEKTHNINVSNKILDFLEK